MTGNDLKIWFAVYHLWADKKICNVQNYSGYLKITLKLQTKSSKDFFIILAPRTCAPKQFEIPKYYSSHDN